MYCAICGSETNPKLNFCSKCGERIERSGNTDSQHRSTAMAAAAIALGGLFITLIILMKLVGEGIEIGAVIAIAAMFLTSVIAMFFIALKMMPGLFERPGSAGVAESVYDPPKSLKTPNTARLESPTEQPASVIENTTRTLDKIPVERQ